MAGLYDLVKLANAAFKVSALFSRPWRSSSDMSGSRTSMTPLRPTTLGSDSVTPNLFCRLPIGITACSSLSTISAMRADTIPMPYWLASWPSMMVMLA